MSQVGPALRNYAVGAAVRAADALGALGAHADTKIFDQMKKMKAAAGRRGGKKILFLSLKSTWKAHVGWEYTLARALEVRGADVAMILCDGFFPKCDVKTHYNATDSRCFTCQSYSRLVAKYSGLRTEWISRYVSPERRAEFDAMARESTDRDVVWKGIDIERAVTPSLHRFYRRASPPPGHPGVGARRLFIESGLLAAEALSNALDEIRPDAAIAVNGKFFAENILLQLCRARGIDCFTYERGKIADTLNFARNTASVDWNLEHLWSEAKDRPLSAEERRRIESFYSERKQGAKTVLQYHPNPIEDAGRIAAELGLGAGRPTIVLFTNIVWDSAVQEKDIAFESMFDWVKKTIKHARGAPGANFVIRVHPAEVKIVSDVTQEKVLDFVREHCGEIPPNVKLIPPESDISSYKLVQLADLVCVYTSTIGIESALEKKPTVVCGETHFSGKGFTIDITKKEQYADILTKAAAGGEIGPFDWDAAWKYAHLFFFRAMIPFPYVHEEKLGLARGVGFKSVDDLAPGKDRNLDAICDAILNGKEPAAPAP